MAPSLVDIQEVPDMDAARKNNNMNHQVLVVFPVHIVDFAIRSETNNS